MTRCRHGVKRFTVSLLASFIVSAGCGADSGSSHRDDRIAGTVPSRALDQEFALFRRPRTAVDVVPKSILPPSVARQIGLDLRTSRLARRYDGNPVYVVRSDRLICTYSRSNEVGNCWPTRTVAQGLASATSICGLGTKPGKIATYGLVPDGVTSVTVRRRDGSDTTVGVRDNMYVAPGSVHPPLPLHIILHQGGRRIVRPTGIPPDVARRGCTRSLLGRDRHP